MTKQEYNHLLARIAIRVVLQLPYSDLYLQWLDYKLARHIRHSEYVLFAFILVSILVCLYFVINPTPMPDDVYTMAACSGYNNQDFYLAIINLFK